MQLCKIILSCILCVQFGRLRIPTTLAKEAARVINGTESAVDQFPWTVWIGLRVNVSFLTHATGSLIHPRVVLSAAHCFDPKLVGNQTVAFRRSLLRIGMGKLRLIDLVKKSVNFGHVKRIHLHRCYRNMQVALYKLFGCERLNETARYDIALLELKVPFMISQSIKTIHLPTFTDTNQVYQNYEVTLAGWGFATLHRDPTEVLRFAKMKVYPNNACLEEFSKKFEDNWLLCVVGRYQTASVGDSGSALLYHDEDATIQIAVASFRINRTQLKAFDPRLVQAFVRIGPHLKWINNTLNEIMGVDVVEQDVSCTDYVANKSTIPSTRKVTSTMVSTTETEFTIGTTKEPVHIQVDKSQWVMKTLSVGRPKLTLNCLIMCMFPILFVLLNLL